jgi:hypothetical protein
VALVLALGAGRKPAAAAAPGRRATARSRHLRRRGAHARQPAHKPVKAERGALLRGTVPAQRRRSQEATPGRTRPGAVGLHETSLRLSEAAAFTFPASAPARGRPARGRPSAFKIAQRAIGGRPPRFDRQKCISRSPRWRAPRPGRVALLFVSPQKLWVLPIRLSRRPGRPPPRFDRQNICCDAVAHLSLPAGARAAKRAPGAPARRMRPLARCGCARRPARTPGHR